MDRHTSIRLSWIQEWKTQLFFQTRSCLFIHTNAVPSNGINMIFPQLRKICAKQRSILLSSLQSRDITFVVGPCANSAPLTFLILSKVLCKRFTKVYVDSFNNSTYIYIYLLPMKLNCFNNSTNNCPIAYAPVPRPTARFALKVLLRCALLKQVSCAQNFQLDSSQICY